MTIDTSPPHSLQGVWAVLASDDKARARRAVTHHLSARWTLHCTAGAPKACHLFFNSECPMIHNCWLFIDCFAIFSHYKVCTFAYFSWQWICKPFSALWAMRNHSCAHLPSSQMISAPRNDTDAAYNYNGWIFNWIGWIWPVTCHKYRHDVTEKVKNRTPEPAYKYCISWTVL